MKDALARRLAMVRHQIERRGIRDPKVLRAMEHVPREAFVPEGIRHRAFDDSALPIACNQTISQPFVVASMCQALRATADDRVLEIGTGSGYAAAVLAELAAEVYTVERFEELADAARDRLARLGYANVHVRCGDGTIGWQEHAPYDRILVSAGAPGVPPSLREQLEIGGTLVIPIGPSHYDQDVVRVVRRASDDFVETRLGGVRFVPLVGEEGWDDDSPEKPGWMF